MPMRPGQGHRIGKAVDFKERQTQALENMAELVRRSQERMKRDPVQRGEARRVEPLSI